MSAYSDRVIADGATFAHPLDDASGNPRNIINAGSPMSNPGGGNSPLMAQPGPGIPGETNQSCEFSNAGVQWFNSAVVPDTNYNLAAGDFTIEAWVNVNAAISGYGTISRNTSGAGGYILRMNDSEQLEGFAGAIAASTTVLASNGSTWYHAVFSREGEVGKLYVNGVLEATVAGQTSGGVTDQAMLIGIWSGPSEKINGFIAWLAGYKTALTPAKILAHYQIGTGTQPAGGGDSRPAGLYYYA